MDVSAITWEGPLSIQEVAQQLIKTLFGPLIKQVPPEEALRGEVLRVAIWEQSVLSQQQSITDARVSTQRVLSRARFLWKPISTALKKRDSSSELHVEDELSRRALDDLAEQGDLLSLSGGQWLPAPLRLVPASLDRYLLVGGLPSSFLSYKILQELHLHGSFRQIETSLIQKYPTFDGLAGHWQFQTQESWLGAPVLTPKELLQKFQAEELLPVVQQVTPQNIEVYVASLDKPQGLRWQPPENVHKNGRYLLRSQTPWGQRFYTIGQFENQRIKRQSQIMESWDIRRLCYALDVEAHMPTRVAWNKQQGILILRSELPVRERKRLAALGSLQTNGADYGYYPRIWHISPHYEPEVQNILKELAIVIQ
jgi:hypothetical protein